MPEGAPAFQDVECSICGRHNRDVHIVATENGLYLCTVCVAKCAVVFDGEAGLEAPAGGWAERWPLKR